VILYGYPGSPGIPNNPQLDPSRPLLRRGLVAGRDQQNRSIIVDGGDPGNDGCPVFEIDPEGYGYSLIGVVSDRLGIFNREADGLCPRADEVSIPRQTRGPWFSSRSERLVELLTSRALRP
jgi:hypothetical protein